MKASSTQNTVETVENGTRPAVKKKQINQEYQIDDETITSSIIIIINTQ